MSVDSIKHNHEQRPHIPSQEEARTEQAKHVAPETLIQSLYRVTEANPQQPDLFTTNELFGNALERNWRRCLRSRFSATALCVVFSAMTFRVGVRVRS